MKISGSHEGVYVNFVLEKGGRWKMSEFIALSTHPPPADVKWTFPKGWSNFPYGFLNPVGERISWTTPTHPQILSTSWQKPVVPDVGCAKCSGLFYTDISVYLPLWWFLNPLEIWDDPFKIWKLTLLYPICLCNKLPLLCWCLMMSALFKYLQLVYSVWA